MKKNKLLLPIYLCLSLVIIIAAVVVSLTVGVNLGVDFNGGKQIEIKLEDNANTSNYESQINDVLKEYGYKIDSSIIQDKYSDSYYVIKINETEISNEKAAEIREKIANKLEISNENVGDVMSISGNVTQSTIITISIAVACVLIVFMIVGWARYGIMEGLSLMFVGLHNMIISLAALLVTTLQLNVPTIVALLVCTVSALVIYTLILENVYESKKLSQNKDLSDNELFGSANKKSLNNVVIVMIALALIAIASLFSGMYYIKLFALSLVVCMIISVYSTNLVGVVLGATLAHVKTTAEKEHLSKNVEQKSTKTQKENK